MHRKRRVRFPLAAALLVLGSSLVACNKPAEPAAAPAAADGTIVVDTSNSRCSLLPPDMVAEYRRAHDLFTSHTPDLSPEFTKGQLFRDGDTIRFKWAQPNTHALTINVDLLQNCSQVTVHGGSLQQDPAGGGVISAQLHTGNAGSSYPSGTPAVVRISSTVVDTSTMKGTTTVIGEYTVRLEGPKE